MAALRASDGAFLLGEMGAHTINAGQIYFAAGTPDRSDIFGDEVDLAASVAREMEEETGFTPAQAPPAPGWSVVVSGQKIACMQERLLPWTSGASCALAPMISWPATRTPNSSASIAVRGPQDIDPQRMPDFIQIFLRDALGSAGRIAVPLLARAQQILRAQGVAGGAGALGLGDFGLDLRVNALVDMAHGEVIVLDRAIAGDFLRAAFGRGARRDANHILRRRAAPPRSGAAAGWHCSRRAPESGPEGARRRWNA